MSAAPTLENAIGTRQLAKGWLLGFCLIWRGVTHSNMGYGHLKLTSNRILRCDDTGRTHPEPT